MRNLSILQQTKSNARVSDGNTEWDLHTLQQAVAAWTRKLDQLAADIVAFDLPNCLEWIALDLALFEAQKVAVPLPSFFSAQQREHAINNSGAQWVVSDINTHAASDATAKQEVFRNTVITPVADAEPKTLPSGTAIITYTSGSTGTPKGACLDAQTLVDTACSIVHTLSDLAIEKHLCVLPLTLLLENVAGLFANLLNGSQIFVPALDTIGIRGSSDVDVIELVQGIDLYAPNSIILVPALLLGVTAAAEFGLSKLESLKFVAVGGGRVAADMLERAAAQNIPVYEGYGLTECGSVVALNTPTDKRAGSVGKLLPHVQASVVKGELVITRPRMLGYLGDSMAKPAQVATGDRVDIDDDGFVNVHGRIKNLFITAYGRNINPEWIESELQIELAIGLALVCGEAEPVNTALIVPRGEYGADDVERAIAHCNERLPDYARISRWSQISWQGLEQAGGITGNGRLKRDVAMKTLETLTKHELQGATL